MGDILKINQVLVIDMNELSKMQNLDSLLIYFTPPIRQNFNAFSMQDPFDNIPDELAIKAADLLKQRLTNGHVIKHPFFKKNEGKMFGVVVVVDAKGKIGYLSAFSGMLKNQWLIPGFVPPIFDVDEMSLVLSNGEKQLKVIAEQIIDLENNLKRRVLLEDLSVLQQQNTAVLIELKSKNNKNKQQRKIVREGIKNQFDATDVLLQLSKQSQDDKRQYKSLKKSCQAQIVASEERLKQLFDDEIKQLKQQRKLLSQGLHKHVFDLYEVQNTHGQIKLLEELFIDSRPPGGSGDCAAPKLIQYALKHGLKVLSLTEFWWGASPKKEIRHHQQFYPPCRSKCHQILPFMLDGLVVKKTEADEEKLIPTVVFEDDVLLVLNKPEGLLSIPGKVEKYSLQTWVENEYPNAEGALLVHRLDQATSGLVLVAKNAAVHKALQKQFIQRTVKKRYVALLAKLYKYEHDHVINLPLRVDLDDRPRQLVCYEYGKAASTRVELIAHEGERSRVYFYPITGRTHQLRVHAAHELGLNNPIVGDTLYGIKETRLMLHAEHIEFFHPLKERRITVAVKAPF